MRINRGGPPHAGVRQRPSEPRGRSKKPRGQTWEEVESLTSKALHLCGLFFDIEVLGQHARECGNPRWARELAAAGAARSTGAATRAAAMPLSPAPLAAPSSLRTYDALLHLQGFASAVEQRGVMYSAIPTTLPRVRAGAASSRHSRPRGRACHTYSSYTQWHRFIIFFAAIPNWSAHRGQRSRASGAHSTRSNLACIGASS